MTRKLLSGVGLMAILLAILSGCENLTGGRGDNVLPSGPLAAVDLQILPFAGRTPQTSLSGSGFDGTITWTTSAGATLDEPFTLNARYTADVTLNVISIDNYFIDSTVVRFNGGDPITAQPTLQGNGRTLTFSYSFYVTHAPLTVTAGAVNYGSGLRELGALTPLNALAYNERIATVTVTVRGFASRENAESVNLDLTITPASSELTFSGYAVGYGVVTGNPTIGFVNTFTVIIEYDGESSSTTDFVLDFELKDYDSSYYAPPSEKEEITLRIADGRAENSAIPVGQSNISAFMLFAHNDGLGKHYRMVQNITLRPASAGNWLPIGTTGSPFTGTFDGDGFSISGLNVVGELDDYQGMFGVVNGNDAQIQRLGLRNGNVSGNNQVGGIAGALRNGAQIEQSFFYGSVSGRGNNVGGLVGRIYAGSVPATGIENSYFAGNITGHTNVGGIAGQSDGAIDLVFSSGLTRNQNGVITAVGMAGGILGLGTAGTIRDSVALNIAFDRSEGSNTDFARIVPELGSKTPTDNRASRSIDASSVFASGDLDMDAARHGYGATLDHTRHAGWWGNPASFGFRPSGDWHWCGVNDRPRLGR